MRHAMWKPLVAGLLAVVSACNSSPPKPGHTPLTLSQVNTAWAPVGNGALDAMGVALAVACDGSKDQMVAWFAKNTGCVPYGQFKNAVRFVMQGVENPTAEELAETEQAALAGMDVEDREALRLHLSTMGDESVGALKTIAGALVAGKQAMDAFKGAKDQLSGDFLEKAEAAKPLIQGLDQAAEMVTFLMDSQAVINQWKAKYQEWGEMASEI